MLMNTGSMIYNDRQTSQSSDKLLQIMESIATSGMPVRLQDLSEQVGMSQPTVLRYLNSLQKANYVYQEENTARYGMTWKICKLTQNTNTLLSLRILTNFFVNQLADLLHQGVCLVVEQNSECVYLDCLDTAASIGATLQRIGKHAPLHATASGKILLSCYTKVQFDQYIAEHGLPALTEHTIVDPNVLFQQLQEVKSQGFAMDEEECELNLRCVSMPLRDYSGRIVAAMSIFGNPASMTHIKIQEDILPALQQTTSLISLRLGYSPDQQS